MTPTGFRALTAMHMRLLIREPGALLFAFLPPALLIIFGNISSFRAPKASLDGRTVLDVYVPTFAAMVPLLLALTVLPGQLVVFREKNALRRFAVSPVPPAGMLAALMAVIAGLAAAGVLVVVGIGALAFGVTAPSSLATVVAAFVLGAAAVLALGLVVAAVASTGAVANALGLPMMFANFFFSGLYVPIAEMPHRLRQVGEFVPFGAVMDAWSGHGTLWQHLLVLTGYTLTGGFAAARLFRWE
jgi:ABC-2 type transport system permease protein